jgi:hypothetical protein
MQEREQLQADYARYQRVTRRYQRMIASISPQALGRRHNIATSTVLDYVRGRHKSEVGGGRADALVRQTQPV